MDFLDPKKKRAHKIRLYIGYALMGLALIVGSMVLFFEARGFDLDRKTGEIIQNGLVFAGAHPESAQIYVNGKREGSTNTRLTIPAGDYNFEYRRDSYRTWSRSFSLGGSELVRLDYAFLFPENLNSQAIRNYPQNPAFATQSPDRKWVVIQQPDSLRGFDLLDISNQNQPTVTSFALPEGLLSNGATHKLETIEWSNDNRRFIVKHTFGNSSEFVLVDREKPAESVNLNRHFNLQLHSVALRDKKFDKLHLLDAAGGTLRFGDLKSKQLSVVANKVFSFKSYSDDVVFYVTSEGAKKNTVRAVIRKGDKNHTLRSMSVSKTYPIDITRYDNVWYLAVSSPSEKKAYIYHDVFKDLERSPVRTPFPLAVFKLDNIQKISVSANTRFISVQSGAEFAVFDAEYDRSYQYDTKLKLGGQIAEWMDGHRLTAVVNNKLLVWEYDGINQQTLVNARPGFLPFFDRDYDFLYTLSPGSGRATQTSLYKTPMRTEADL